MGACDHDAPQAQLDPVSLLQLEGQVDLAEVMTWEEAENITPVIRSSLPPAA
jgi:hypothetical protein